MIRKQSCKATDPARLNAVLGWLVRCCALSAGMMLVGGIAMAADYKLSPDGLSVVRIIPSQSLNANGLAGASLPDGYTVTTGSGASPTIDSYDAGYRDGGGGAEFTATYTHGTLGTGEALDWVQTVTTNVPLGGNTSPYLDNAANTSVPFYSFTQENRDPNLPANQLNFYDYSTRSPTSLASTNPITWTGDLYPVVTTSGSEELEVQNGVRWGWTMKKAPVGSTSGRFTDPAPAGAVTSGVGTSTFTWGNGSPSSMSFAGTTFDTTPNTPFNLGTLTFTNGPIDPGSEASSVNFNVDLVFDNIAEKNFTLTTPFQLVNTPNTDDPVASADQVFASDYNVSFNVFEGASASVDILAILTATLTGSPSGSTANASLFQDTPFDREPDFGLRIAGFVNPTQGGFVVAPVPLPASAFLMLSAVAALWGVGRPRSTRS